MNSSRPVVLSDLFDVNPKRSLAKGHESTFVAMADLAEHQRSISSWTKRPFKSGSRFQNGDVLVARITPCLENGKTALVDILDEGAVGHGSTEFIVLSARDGVADPLFGYYLATSPCFRDYATSRMIGSSGRQRVSAGEIGEFKLEHVPTIEEQRAIAEVLGALDDRIEWCANLAAKCSETQAARFAELQEQATSVRLGHWAYLDKGVSYKGDFISSSDSDLPLMNLGLFGRSSRVRWENLKRYSGPVKERHKVYSNDVVVCATDMTQDRAVLGSVAIVPEWLATASITHHLYALRLREGAPFPAWMAGLAISHEPTRRLLAEAANGTTVLALPKDIIEGIEVPVLSSSDLQAADGMFWSLQSLIELHEAEQSRLSQLRDALLPQLVSGELRIADPQRILDQVE